MNIFIGKEIFAKKLNGLVPFCTVEIEFYRNDLNQSKKPLLNCSKFKKNYCNY